MAKIIQIAEKITVNHDTGEVKEEERSRIINLPSEPPFVKMYLEDISKLFDVPAGPRVVLYQLVRKMDYDGYISLTSAARKRIAESCELTVGSFNNYLTDLCKVNILKNIGRGEYEVNPHLFAKGEWKDISRRRQSFQLSITYDETGRRVVTGKFLKNESEQLDLI